MRVLEKRVLRRRGDRGLEKTTMRSLIICTLKLNTDRVLGSNRMKRAGHMAIVGAINAYRILVG